MQSDPILLGRPVQVTGRVEIVRSFSFKLNAGHYESRDFFCSQKAECAIEDAEHVSELLHEFCKKSVLASVHAYSRENRKDAGSERRIA